MTRKVLINKIPHSFPELRYMIAMEKKEESLVIS